MKSLYLSLTFLIAFLPALTPTFNIFKVEGKNETLSKTHKHTSCSHSEHSNHAGCFFQNHHSTIVTERVAFGAEMGKLIRASREDGYRIKKVVLDPGHGGKDPGCSGTGTKEKQIALAIALQLGKTLEHHFPDVQFIYTRKTDVFVPLDRRAKIANEHAADLFISIHCNNFPKSGNVKGSETYVLGLHRADDNLEVAKRENAAIFYEDNYEETYGGYDPNSAEGHIILSMYQNAYLEQSISFANKIESNIKRNSQHKSRGVRQAGFLVLRETTMPSVLVETGYLSNAWDNRFLDSANGKAQVVNAIAQAFASYKREVEGTPGSEIVVAKPYTAQSVKRVQKRSAPVAKPAPRSQVSVNSLPQKQTKLTPKSGNSSLSKQSLIIPSKHSYTPDNTPTAKRPPKAEAIQYKVLLASSSELIDTDQGNWLNLPYSVQVVRDGNHFKYLAVGFENFEKAVQAKSELRKIGFKEAFLVAYQGGKRIDMKVAMSKTGIK